MRIQRGKDTVRICDTNSSWLTDFYYQSLCYLFIFIGMHYMDIIQPIQMTDNYPFLMADTNKIKDNYTFLYFKRGFYTVVYANLNVRQAKT